MSFAGIRWYAIRLLLLMSQMKTSGKACCGSCAKFRSLFWRLDVALILSFSLFLLTVAFSVRAIVPIWSYKENKYAINSLALSVSQKHIHTQPSMHIHTNGKQKQTCAQTDILEQHKDKIQNLPLVTEFQLSMFLILTIVASFNCCYIVIQYNTISISILYQIL